MKSEVTFRYATAADFGAVLELASQLAREIECEPPPLTAAELEAYYVGPHAPMHLLLAIQNGQIVGMIAWTLTHELYSADTRVYISDVSVDQSARGKGIGAALMNEVTIGLALATLQNLAGRSGTETLPPRPFISDWEPQSTTKRSPLSWHLTMNRDG